MQKLGTILYWLPKFFISLVAVQIPYAIIFAVYQNTILRQARIADTLAQRCEFLSKIIDILNYLQLRTF